MKEVRQVSISKNDIEGIGDKSNQYCDQDGIASTLDEDIILNILPSYHMYQNQISRNLIPSADNFRIRPPIYERASSNSVVGAESSSENESALSDQVSPRAVDYDTPATLWEDSVLANTPKLRRVFKESDSIKESLELKIQVTQGLAKIGQKPKYVDPLYKEFHQGDYINGYVTIRNTTETNIPFEIFDVVFDGVLTLDDEPDKEPHVTKFLNMLDFNASWNDGFLNRLTTEDRNPHGPCPDDAFDRFDNTMTQLSPDKVFEPGVTYKKFFTFKIPQKLLDSICVPHRLVKHLQLPPTYGTSSYETAQGNYPGSLVEDFSVSGTSISYSLSARVISKASEYPWLTTKNKKENPDEYVIIQETNSFLRFMPYKNRLFRLNQESILGESRLVYKNIIWNIEEKIKKWENSKEVVDETDKPSDDTALEPSTTKLRQLYPKVETSSSNMYEVIANYVRKSILGTKTIGVLSLSTPKKEYQVDYFPILKYGVDRESRLEVPLEINFMYTDNQTFSKPPNIKTVRAELVVCTISSKKKLNIPVVITHDMLFENKFGTNDNFESLTIGRFQKYAMRLNSIIQKVGVHKLDLDPSLLDDVKCIANLKCNYVNLHADKAVQVRGNSGEKSLELISWNTDRSANEIKYTKKFNVCIDFKMFKHKEASEFNLVPEFQNCSIARLYYLNLILDLPNGSKLHIKVPILIQKDVE
ncbi:hypothetical protein CLIB1423_02S11936 [[Candida] railenensis]|uniref:Bul1 N-terminal domain-containing protein n=1 Tax=[Candida] railenensis TaxID=45579 RepID=A0A9P0QM77_9ASCO|nr:hypothetical protein CLIB1423_02S11936 [[Candida] railenensis]